MAYTTFSYGSTNANPFNGFRPPYKIGDYFTFPTISGRDAPGFTGNSAKPALIRTVSIAVGGYNTSAATSQFGVWDSNGSNGRFSSTFTLPNGGSSYPPKVSKTLSTSKQVFASGTYIVGFLKRNTSSVLWGVDTSKSGSVIEDNTNSGNSTSFEDDGAYRSGSLVWTISYDILPPKPTGLTLSLDDANVELVWTAPVLVPGETPITGYRIQRSLDNSTWTTLVSNTASTAVSYTDTTASSGVTYYYRVAAHNEVSTTFGSSYSGPYGDSASILTVTPEPGKTTSTLTVSVNNTNPTPVVFSDNGGGIPYEGIEVVYGSENLFNRVTATPKFDSENPVTVEASQSQILYGVRGYDLGAEFLNRDIEDVSKAANAILYRSYLPNLRVEAITIRMNSLSALQLLEVLSVDIDDIIAVYFTPNGVGEQIQTNGRVVAVSHDADIESHSVSFRLSSVDNTPFVLDSPTLGQLDGNILG
jgi:hypothetical protein